jgi:hypothetical protein
MRKQYIQEKRYTINWYRNGFCYRTTMDCTKEYVNNCKKLAKLIGETIKIELEQTIKIYY